MNKYRSSSQMAWESSPIYNAIIYRKDETLTKESVLEDFMYFIERESEYETTSSELEKLQNMINEFFGYDIDKVKAGELEMLEKWNNAVNDTVSK